MPPPGMYHHPHHAPAPPPYGMMPPPGPAPPQHQQQYQPQPPQQHHPAQYAAAPTAVAQPKKDVAAATITGSSTVLKRTPAQQDKNLLSMVGTEASHAITRISICGHQPHQMPCIAVHGGSEGGSASGGFHTQANASMHTNW